MCIRDSRWTAAGGWPAPSRAASDVDEGGSDGAARRAADPAGVPGAGTGGAAAGRVRPAAATAAAAGAAALGGGRGPAGVAVRRRPRRVRGRAAGPAVLA